MFMLWAIGTAQLDTDCLDAAQALQNAAKRQAELAAAESSMSTQPHQQEQQQAQPKDDTAKDDTAEAAGDEAVPEGTREASKEAVKGLEKQAWPEEEHAQHVELKKVAQETAAQLEVRDLHHEHSWPCVC